MLSSLPEGVHIAPRVRSQRAQETVRQTTRGRPPRLEQAIARFVAEVAALPAEGIPARWRAEVAAHLHDRAPATRRVYVSRYRAALADALGRTHPALGVVVARDSPERPAAAPNARVSESRPEAGADTRPSTRAPTRGGRDAPPADVRPGAGSRPIGRPSVLRDAVAGFVGRLRRASGPREIERLWAEEFAKHDAKTDRTRKLYVSQYYRPAIRAALGDDHPALDVVKTPGELSDRIRSEDVARVAASHRDLIEVAHWREIVARGTRLLASRAPLDLAVGLLCVTGRRPYEVLCTGRFTPAPMPGGAERARSRWSVLFTGQAKTKERPGTRYGVAYTIPVLAEARAAIAALDALRASPEGREWDGLSNEGFSRLTNSVGVDRRIPLREAVAAAFGDVWPAGDRLTPRSLRPLYAEVAYKHFAPKHVSKNSFFSAILGHTLKDLETSLSYMDYYLGEEDAAGARGAAAGLENRLVGQVDSPGLNRG